MIWNKKCNATLFIFDMIWKSDMTVIDIQHYLASSAFWRTSWSWATFLTEWGTWQDCTLHNSLWLPAISNLRFNTIGRKLEQDMPPKTLRSWGLITPNKKGITQNVTEQRPHPRSNSYVVYTRRIHRMAAMVLASEMLMRSTEHRKPAWRLPYEISTSCCASMLNSSPD